MGSALILRDYQAGAVDSVFNYFGSNKGNPLVLMPTGTGKSLVIAGFLQRALELYPYQKIQVLTHVKELIEQNHDKLIRLWPTAPAGIYSAGLRKREMHNAITFGGIGSIFKRAVEVGHVDLIFIDEAHLVSPKANTKYQSYIKDLKKINPYLKVIGLTATDYRLGDGSLVEDENSIFTDVCFDMTDIQGFNWFLEQGYLAPLIPKRTTTTLDVDGVHMRGGDYNANQLQLAVDQDEITDSILREVCEQAHDRNSWLIFASGIDHANHIAEKLTHFGIECEAVHSKMKAKERDKIIDDFTSGRLRCVVNNGILTTGFDHPELDLIVVMRPTASCALWVQMLGRGTRPVYAQGFDLSTVEGRLLAMQNSNKQDCLVLDFAGNSVRLGPINDPLKPSKRRKGNGPIMKACENCEIYIPIAFRTCPHCQYEFNYALPLGARLSEKAGTIDLIKTELPITDEFEIDHITYARHKKVGRPDSLKVTYTCGLHNYREFICFEHGGGAARTAARWWKERDQSLLIDRQSVEKFVPETVTQALELINTIKTATSIRVWINTKYPKIMAFCFDGSHFGKQEPNDIKPDFNFDDNKYDEKDIPF